MEGRTVALGGKPQGGRGDLATAARPAPIARIQLNNVVGLHS